MEDKKLPKTPTNILVATKKYRDKIKSNKDERYYNRLKYFKEYYKNKKPKTEKDKLRDLLDEALEKLKQYENQEKI